MGIFGGWDAKFYYVLEAEAYGVTPSNPAFLGVENVENIEPFAEAGTIKVRGLGSRDVTRIAKGLKQVGVSVDYAVPATDIFSLMQSAITVFPHTCEVVYERPDNSLILRFLGCKMNRLEVSCSIEDVLKASAEFFGQKLVTDQPKIEGATYTDFLDVVAWHECKVELGQADGSGMETLDNVSNWKFVVNNDLKRVPVIRNVEGDILRFLEPRSRSLSGELVLDYLENRQFYDAITDGEFSLKFGLGSKYVLFTYCKLDNATAPTRPEDFVAVRAPFTARKVKFEDIEDPWEPNGNGGD